LQSAIVQIEVAEERELGSELFWLSDEQWKRIEPFLPTDVREVERVDGRRVISGIGQVLKSGLFGRDAMAMKDRNLIAAGVVAVIAAVCCNLRRINLISWPPPSFLAATRHLPRLRLLDGLPIVKPARGLCLTAS
jgi:hypothetical protein